MNIQVEYVEDAREADVQPLGLQKAAEQAQEREAKRLEKKQTIQLLGALDLVPKALKVRAMICFAVVLSSACTVFSLRC